jgi:hypothetical protein
LVDPIVSSGLMRASCRRDDGTSGFSTGRSFTLGRIEAGDVIGCARPTGHSAGIIAHRQARLGNSRKAKAFEREVVRCALPGD